MIFIDEQELFYINYNNYNRKFLMIAELVALGLELLTQGLGFLILWLGLPSPLWGTAEVLREKTWLRM